MCVPSFTPCLFYFNLPGIIQTCFVFRLRLLLFSFFIFSSWWGAAGGNDNQAAVLQQHQREMLDRLREIRTALATESGDLESVKAANSEVAKLREVIKRKDYRILHLTRALDSAAPAVVEPPSV